MTSPRLAFSGSLGNPPFVHRLARLLTSRYSLAAVTGGALACAFPMPGLAGIAWIAPGILLACAFGRPGWERFRIGFIGGIALALCLLSWLLNIPFRWMGVPLGPAAGWLALSAYVALYTAAWVWLVTTTIGPVASSARWADTAEGIAQKGWLFRSAIALYAAASWVGLEMMLARLFSGFPWQPLGVSQYKVIPLIQISAVTGVHGVSFLVAWVSVALLMAAIMMMRRPPAKSLWALEILVPFLTVGLLVGHGMRELRGAPSSPSRTIKAALVQPSIPQTLIWDPSKSDQRFEELLRLSEIALTNKPDLLIWPESAVPALFRQDEEARNAITSLARRHSVWMIIGADDFSIKPGGTAPRDVLYHNSSFLISPDGAVLDSYRKRNLVIFGEYVPLERWIPFVKYLTPIQGGFTPGEKSEQFELDSLGIVVSPLICFEDIFAGLGRDGAQADTDFLVNLTNNGWFGDSAAQWQHTAAAVFRAVENRIPLVRCTNNGLTCWVDSFGRIRAALTDANGSVYGPGFLICDVPALGPDELRGSTPYHRHGDRFGWACVLVTIIWAPIRALRDIRGISILS
jgi:apolipoprotein N-acyltransferase